MGPPYGSVVKTLCWIWSLARELRSHMLLGTAKKKKKTTLKKNNKVKLDLREVRKPEVIPNGTEK